MSTLPKESSSVNGQPLPNGHPAPNGLAQLNDVLATYPSLAELFRRMADPRDQRTVGELIGLYLEDAKDEIDTRTLEDRTRELGRFREAFGSRMISDCTPFDLKQWLFAQKA